ncbi:hypothetical protein COW81_00275 [Candidatus Campbellbacteria bacterium CG22_combo_CG10-13_8_21_14_all_36_13]|uniref:DOD-type homing endonuclease domain-containing protein n=1 Tax=Candidatus Campbellbacteria bacterium CG22_combo_CG10-13_8_21_14_all_36_13 TaxID=1974529 RepID=A0A2H0DZ23_9BACT|nr:MAG: hypothetical protein COW81_00275 [Candidatus Campbellbacteria bacterium CG22_combo_CG10-13_8_21_14_all_36_13]
MGIKYKVNEDFFKKWSREMAYMLGYIYADGHLEDAPYIRGKYLRITSIDKDSIVNLRKLLNSDHKIVITPKIGNRKTHYLLRIGSHVIFNDLLKHGLYPKKSLTIKLPNVPEKYVGDFVRGYFDGDGCIHLEIHNKCIKCVRTIFTSGSNNYLVKLARLLTLKAEMTPRKLYNGTRAYQLRYNTRDSKKLFEFMYKNIKNQVFLERKYKMFLKYFNYRKERKNGKKSKNVIRYRDGLVAKG